jgi:asparagine synthase (glutamine-hydrolysing)
MCGIAGKVFADAGRQVDEELILRMCQAMVHRGPDDQGIRADGRVGMGMRRLKVIDLDTGQQPMCNEDGTLWIVFNGEIYNYRQLRLDLQQRGHVLATASDTETILHLYEDYGDDCVRHLRGMFAFAIWDSKAERLFIARDQVGKKPLYYSEMAGSLAFASELGALVQDAAVDTEIDPCAVDEYLTYLFVPHPRTIYRGARKLPPGSRLVYQRGQVSVERYWTVHYGQPVARDLDSSVEQLDEILREAVRLRMLADVPVGAFLSGGLDSSLVVALMQQVSNRPVRTFAIGFEDSTFNETDHARTVADYLGTEHQEHIVRYDVRDLLPELVGHFGEPFADSSAIPTYHLSRMTRQQVTVALSGDGGDEIFGGYRRYQARHLAERYNQWPWWAGRGPLEKLVDAMPEPDGYYGQSLRKKTKRFVEFARAVRESPQTSWAFFLTRAEKEALYTEEFAAHIGCQACPPSMESYWRDLEQSPGQEMLWLDLMTYLPDDILAKVDRMSMACSLEARSPLLDTELIEFAAALPVAHKLTGRSTKIVLRRLAQRYLPQEILDRPKQGFAIPLGGWLRDELKPWMEELLLGGGGELKRIVRLETLERMIGDHQRGRRDLSQQLWALMVLAVWLRGAGELGNRCCEL